MSDTQSQENVIDSPSTHGTTTSASPGELLARQREQLGIPLADAARALNLRPAVVGGLEQDDYQEIPVAAYRRGYLRSYAKYLGMDDRLVLEAYQARSGGTDTERKVSPVSTARPPSRIGAWLFKLVTLLVIVGLIAVTVMWWQSRGGNEPPGFGSTATEETATAPAEPASEPTDTEESASSSFTSGDESATLPSNATNVTPSSTSEQGQAPSAQADADAIAGLDASILDSDSGADAEGDELSSTGQNDSDPSATEQSSADSEQTAAVEQTANANVLELTFNEQSWTEIFDATNQRVFVGLQTPGTSTTVEGEPPFRLTVGNATGVELRYQGEEVDLPARAGANNVARFTLGE
ncbi:MULTISPECIES: RodZ domain-containing protein [unclassified Halomonas]|uniref:RodZ domain-containing protein n=1 Tax=unclassified Halomonas TaxID=2609666 RepID=UPI0007DA25F6|nr:MULTISPECIES: RodZ domain-containing protein [unclassified Halomonas]MBT2786787.1 helix-turn-helix domain-containing protein [Halomonas sp. ISL-106]MBT2798560.1 helix-turn-helix domain-containing protein [Halomonas sp. ISL-104]OAL58071.1 cytoskeleton protein rodZ [Halomonas sp. ALS9]